MRVATYLIDPADPKAECVVYYFGEGQGGATDANISRWINQVKQPDGSDSNAKAQRGTVDFRVLRNRHCGGRRHLLCSPPVR